MAHLTCLAFLTDTLHHVVRRAMVFCAVVLGLGLPCTICLFVFRKVPNFLHHYKLFKHLGNSKTEISSGSSSSEHVSIFGGHFTGGTVDTEKLCASQGMCILSTFSLSCCIQCFSESPGSCRISPAVADGSTTPRPWTPCFRCPSLPRFWCRKTGAGLDTDLQRVGDTGLTRQGKHHPFSCSSWTRLISCRGSSRARLSFRRSFFFCSCTRTTPGECFSLLFLFFSLLLSSPLAFFFFFFFSSFFAFARLWRC